MSLTVFRREQLPAGTSPLSAALQYALVVYTPELSLMFFKLPMNMIVRRSRLWMLLAVGLTVVPVLVNAQQLSGVVRDSGTAAPLSGAVITLLDGTGSPPLRSISNERGSFSFAESHSARRIRVVRIGDSPREITVGLESAPSHVVIAMQRLPIVLGEVRIAERPLCRGSREGSAAFELWDQVRSALLASVVAFRADSGVMRIVAYQNDLSPLMGWFGRNRRLCESARC
jgi:hypothetical protein